MQLRIYRTYSWGYKGDPFNMRFGDGNGSQLSLISHDELQVYSHGVWEAVPVVEAEKPEHPKAKQQREEMERMTLEVKKIFENSKPTTWEELQKGNEKFIVGRLGGRR